MTVETPDHYGGKPIPDDAIEIALAAEKKNRNEGEASPLADFIYVPSIKLHFAKERSHLGKNWYDAHKELHKQNLIMPTIPEFVEFLKYLRTNPTAENTRVYNEITEARDPSRAEHLDANFYTITEELWVGYNHIVDSNGDIVTMDHRKLEGHFMQNKTPGISLEHWLNNPTKQGLPQENSEQGGLWYWHPIKHKVALFIANFESAYLNCSADPSYSRTDQGVRAVRTSTQNAGGKQ